MELESGGKGDGGEIEGEREGKEASLMRGEGNKGRE